MREYIITNKQVADSIEPFYRAIVSSGLPVERKKAILDFFGDNALPITATPNG